MAGIAIALLLPCFEDLISGQLQVWEAGGEDAIAPCEIGFLVAAS